MELEFNLPTPTILTLSEPWILYKGRLFQIAKSDSSIQDNYAEMGSGKFCLEEIESPMGLEDLYFVRNAQLIEGFEQEYMRRAVNVEFRSRRSIEDELGKNKVLNLLVTKILPTITSYGAEEQLSGIIESDLGVSHQGSFLDMMASQQSGRRRQSRQADNDFDMELTERVDEDANGRERGRRRQVSASPENAELHREIEKQKRALTTAINRDYRQYERSSPSPEREAENRPNEVYDRLSQMVETHSASGERNPELTVLRDGSILSTHVFPQRCIMYHHDTVYELMTSAEWFQMFAGSIESHFYSRLRRFAPSKDPAELHEIIRQNMDCVEKSHLSRIMNKLRSSKFRIEGVYYFPIQSDDRIEDIIGLYKKLTEKRIKLAAVEHNEFQAVQMAEIGRQRELLSKISEMNKFELNGAGFEVRDGRYYVYVTTPPYALKSPHIRTAECYKEFPPAKVGISVCYDTYRKSFQLGPVLVMNDYSHPFLPYGGGSMRNLCTGTVNQERLRGLPPEEAVPALLSKGKEILMMGYRSGNNPYNRLTTETYRGWMSKRDVERKGLVCLNEFGDDKHGRA